MKKIGCERLIRLVFLVLLIQFTATLALYSQYSTDPYDQIYRDISRWESMGYIKHVPNFRPLPEVVLIDLMEQIIGRNDSDESKRAQYYLDRLTPKFHFFTDISFSQKNNFSENSKDPFGLMGSAYFGGSAYYNKFSIAGGFSGNALLTNPYDNRSAYRNSFYSKILLSKREEISDLTAFSIDDFDVGLSFGVRSTLTLGTKNFFFQGGISRRSIGPFFDDGLVASSRAELSPNFIVHWRGKKMAATWGVFGLSARKLFSSFDVGTRDDDTDEFIVPPSYTESYDLRTNKYFFYHNLTFFLGENFRLNVFEGHMTGEISLANLMPMKIMYQLGSFSNYGNYSGNTYLGFSSSLRFFETFTIPIVLYVDDVNVVDLAAFDFDTKIKLAAQLGLRWAPRKSTLNLLSLDYQIVLPYTYTHNSTSGLYSSQYNTENYLHLNQPFATSLLPSSHRMTFEFELKPLSFLTIGGMSRLSQHNNASENLLEGPFNDGGYLDDGYYSTYDNKSGPSYQNRNGFLEGTVETKLELGFTAGAFLPINRQVTIYGDLAYTYEFYYNYKLQPDALHQEHILLYSIGIRVSP